MFATVLGVTNRSPIRLRRFIWTTMAFWTVAIAIVLTWELRDEQQKAFETARSEARGAWKKEAAVYLWAAASGRVYVPVTEKNRPDPNLAHMAERDISTPAGFGLTLISPPTIMDQVHDIARSVSGVEGHITSLHPIDEENAPDTWERNALESFINGVPEVYSRETVRGRNYLRFMRPLITEASCIACHAEQGYKVGDVRGGLSISVPMDSLWGEDIGDTVRRIAGYGGMWLLGLFGIVLMSRRLHHQISRRYEAEQKLQEANELLERRVAERTAELAEANRNLEAEIADRKQTEEWLLESEQRFRSYFEQGLVGMAIFGSQREWIEVNSRLCRMLGYTEAELLVKDWRELTHPEHQPADEAQFRQLLDGVAHGFVRDTQLVRKDGTTLTVGLSTQCLKKPDGTIDCILVLVQDMHRKST